MIRGILKFCLMLVLIPAYIALKLAEGVCSLVQLVSGWIFRALGLIILATAMGCWLLHLEEMQEVIRIGVAGLVVFLLPIAGELAIAGLMLLDVLVKRAMAD